MAFVPTKAPQQGQDSQVPSHGHEESAQHLDTQATAEMARLLERGGSPHECAELISKNGGDADLLMSYLIETKGPEFQIDVARALSEMRWQSNEEIHNVFEDDLGDEESEEEEDDVEKSGTSAASSKKSAGNSKSEKKSASGGADGADESDANKNDMSMFSRLKKLVGGGVEAPTAKGKGDKAKDEGEK